METLHEDSLVLIQQDLSQNLLVDTWSGDS
jgi:hypothetical protein